MTRFVAGRYIPDLLVSSLPEQPDPNPQTLQKLRDFLANIAQGEDVPLMTPGLRAALDPNAKTILAARLKDLKDFTFITCDELQGRVLERYGARISRLCYYKMRTGMETRYYTFWLTPEGQVTDFGSSTK